MREVSIYINFLKKYPFFLIKWYYITRNFINLYIRNKSTQGKYLLNVFALDAASSEVVKLAGAKFSIYGANKEEANNFPDNTEEFRAQITKCFKTSTQVHPAVIAPLINYTKDDIVRIAVEHKIPLEFVMSCYNSGEKHCGVCESCHYLKKALLANNCEEYINILF